jgi:hypothetical protein
MPEEEKQAEEKQEAPAPSPESEEPPAETEGGVQKRINKLTAEKYAERNRADRLEAQLKELQAPVPPPTEPQELTLEVNEKLQSFRQEETQAQQDTKRQQAAQDFAKRVGESGLEDYSQVVKPLATTVPLDLEVIDVIQADERGPEVAYYLGKNLDVASRITSMSPVMAAAEIGRISAKLSATKKPDISKAPNPVIPVGSGGAISKSFEEMSMKEIDALDM